MKPRALQLLANLRKQDILSINYQTAPDVLLRYRNMLPDGWLFPCRACYGSGNKAHRRSGSAYLIDFTHIKRWTRPSSYLGDTYEDYYVFLGQHRDSDALARSNFRSGLKQIGGEKTGDDGTPLVMVERFGHWGVGWVETIFIHKTAKQILGQADKILAKLEDYPVVDESDWSELETEEANRIWATCYNEHQRLDYIRKHQSQFEFRDFADLISCVRGRHFAGYASELCA